MFWSYVLILHCVLILGSPWSGPCFCHPAPLGREGISLVWEIASHLLRFPKKEPSPEIISKVSSGRGRDQRQIVLKLVLKLQAIFLLHVISASQKQTEKRYTAQSYLDLVLLEFVLWCCQIHCRSMKSQDTIVHFWTTDRNGQRCGTFLSGWIGLSCASLYNHQS